MNEYDKKEIEKYYDLVRDITGDDAEVDKKPLRVYQALANGVSFGKMPVFVALKEMDEKRAEIYKKMGAVYHPNLSHVFSVHKLTEKFHLAGDDLLYDKYLAITEFVFGPNLDGFINKNGVDHDGIKILDLHTALQISIQLCEGLMALHKAGFIHRDVKPSNIIIEKNSDNTVNAKIIDFGSADIYDPNKEYATEFTGTTGFRAPESYDSVVTAKADQYSVGVILNYMLTGYLPTQRLYRGNVEIQEIIEKSTSIDIGYRYQTMYVFTGMLKHAARDGILNKIPIIRSIPCFKTGLAKRAVLGAFLYSFMLIFFADYMTTNASSLELWILIFGFIIPIIVWGDVGSIQYYIARKIKDIHKRNALYVTIGISCAAILMILGVLS